MEPSTVNADDIRNQAERLFAQPDADGKLKLTDYEARARDIRQKIEYLRSLRLADQACGKTT